MNTIDFALAGDHIALYHLLKLTGVSPSGGSAKVAIEAGAVQVDGQIETRKACKIRAGQSVETDNATIRVVAAPED